MKYNQVYKMLRAYNYSKPRVEAWLDAAHNGSAQTIYLDPQRYILAWNKEDGFTLYPVQKI